MLFSGIPFLFYFLPCVLLVYFAVPQKGRNAVLLAASLFFYGWGEPKFLLFMVFSIVQGYLFARLIERGRRKKLFLALSLAVSFALLGYCKYADFFIENVNAVTGLSLPLLKIALPIGISFYTFQIAGYEIDVYRGNVAAQRNFIDFAAYVAMFPQLIAGPIVRYRDIAAQLRERTHSLEAAASGASRFAVGLGKKVLVANVLAQLVSAYKASAEQTALYAWLYAIAFTLQIYFDFSGYSDMAIGLGRMLGFRFPENFRYPYMSRSVTEFWRRWHMTLGGWFRDYVYIPMGGNRVRRGRWVVNILTVWMLTGLWHGAAWNFVLWGLLFAALLLLEKVLPLDRLPGALRHGYVMLAVVLSFVLFNAGSLSQAAGDFRCLFGLGGLPLFGKETGYYLASCAPLFLMGILGATPLPCRLGQRLEKTRVGGLLEAGLMTGLLLVCTGYLVDGSFSPFLYFRF
ncbi:MAG: MBOAT family O-acyltransferase [Candidatus Faecousia sp.]|nr:MBOAT family O-acyltransferase [Candidatus Faecousia sp.]